MGTTLIEEPTPDPRKKKGTTLVEPVTGSGTRLVEPAGKAAEPSAAKAEPEKAVARADTAGKAAVVGWLVITAGPGKGRSLELGYGMNIVGRLPGNRIALDFGDDQISGEDHFRIAYDGANRQFHLVPGRGTNLVYCSDSPLLSPVVLEGGTEMSVGDTRLRFVPLCGPDWDWEAQG